MRCVKGSVNTGGTERKRKRKKLNESAVSDGDAGGSGSENDWGDEDNNDYLNFLRDFFFPNPSKSTDAIEDDEADPEYKIREDEEEDHDREELRRDPAVKISKKELNELLAEVFDDAIALETKVDDDKLPESFHDTSGGLQNFEQQTQVPQTHDHSFLVPNPPPPAPPISLEPLTIVTEPPPLFTETDIKKIQYQLQRHVQQLSQTYVLSATCTDTISRQLAGESKKMILELNSFAKSLAPNSVFCIKNVSHASSLVNAWPPNIISKSPIKKKILEERYLNEVLTNTSGNLFTRNVVKTIAESAAFMYPDLLPMYHDLKASTRLKFTESEDALIAIAYVEMMKNPVYAALKIRERASMISKVLLPGRNQKQVYYRVKNALRKKNTAEGSPEDCEGSKTLSRLQYYLANKTKPPSPLDKWDPSSYDLEPMPPIQQEELPQLWVSLICKWQVDNVYKDPSINKCRKRRTLKKPKKRSKSSAHKYVRKSDMRENSFRHLDVGTGPGEGEASVDDNDMQRMPVYTNEGDVAAYILIPKKYCPPEAKTTQGDVSNSKPSTSSTDAPEDSSSSQTSDSELDDTMNSHINSTVLAGSSDQSKSSTETTSSKPMPVKSVKGSPKPKKRKIKTASVIDSSSSNREEHSARTWVYIRKTPEEVAKCIERKLKLAKRASAKRITSPRKDVTIAARKKQMKYKSQIIKNSEKRGDEDKSQEFESHSQLELTDAGDNSSGGSTEKNRQGTSGATSGKQSRTGGVSDSKSGTSDPGKSTAGGGDDEDQDNSKRRRVCTVKDDDGENKEDDTEDEEKEDAVVSPRRNGSSKQPGGDSKADGKVTKKTKRSPGSQYKKRITKYKTAEIQKLLDDAESEVNIEAIETAFAEEFWAKCQHTIDPSMYNSLIQIFVDFGDKKSSEDEVFVKAQEILKDHPDLLVDLATMIDPQILQKNNLLRDNYSCQAYIRFMHLLEKLTLQCPQLKSRVLQKLRSLRDVEKVTENDVLELVDLYFQGNPIMSDALKAMFPAIFPPESSVREEDFEEINFDEEQPQSLPAEDNMEIVTLPEESNIPATNSCPCDCHTEPQNVNFSTKARHCRKCCIKDGKVFMLSGRVMKQVNIEFTTKEMAEKILAGVACSHCFKPVSSSPNKSSSPKKPPKKRPIKTVLSDCESEPETKRPVLQATKGAHSAPMSSSTTAKVVEQKDKPLHEVVGTKQSNKRIDDDDLEDGEILDDEESQESDVRPAANVENTRIAQTEKCSEVVTEPTKPGKWSYTEDSLLLLSCQKEASLTLAVTKLLESKALPNRTASEIQQRLEQLMQLLAQSQTSE